jgi:hypothetical protein
MKDLLGFLKQLQSMADDLDEDDFDFDIETNVSSASGSDPLGSKPRSTRRSTGRRPSRKSGSSSKSGSDKFEAKRKVKKLNRLIKKAERKGADLDDMFGEPLSDFDDNFDDMSSGEDKDTLTEVRIDEEAETATILIDSPDAEAERGDGFGVVEISYDDGENTLTHEFEFVVKSLAVDHNHSMSTVQINKK